MQGKKKKKRGIDKLKMKEKTKGNSVGRLDFKYGTCFT